MQQEPGGDGLRVGGAGGDRGPGGRGVPSLLVSSVLLLASALAVGVQLLPELEDLRCLAYWDDGTKVVLTPPTRVDDCRWFERSPCYAAGFADEAPARHVFYEGAPFERLRLAYGSDPQGATVLSCGRLTALQATEVPAPEQLLSSRLHEGRVELRHLDGRVEPLARSGERYPCGRGRGWCWVGPSTAEGIPVVRAHLVQDTRVLLSVPRREGDGRLRLRYGFTAEGERLRTPLLGFARLRVRSGGRTLHTGVLWPGVGDRGALVDVSRVPVGASVDLVLEGLGSRFGEVWLLGRFVP